MRQRRLTEEHRQTVPLEIAPLTVTANPRQKIGLGWQWGDTWSDQTTGWTGAWAIDRAGSYRKRAVRVRVMDEWPTLSVGEFFGVLCDAMRGVRPPSVSDEARWSEELASAPMGPVEDLGGTLSAQLRALVSDE